MKNKAIKTIKERIDPETKRHVITVPLGDSDKSVVLYRRDFADLMDLGLSALWSYRKRDDSAAAWLKKFRQWGSIARLIADAGPNQNVSFRDGNRLNCRSDNLILVQSRRGSAKRRDREGIEPILGWHKHVVFEDTGVTN